MPKDWKIQEVQELTEKINSVSTFFVTEYRGLTVKEMWELRGNLRQADAEYKVVHNRLMKIAMDNTGYGDHKKYFVGPVGVVFAKKDPAKAAKALMDFAKAHEKMVIKAGLMDKVMLDKTQVQALANLPSREVLIGKVVSSISSPLYGFLRVLQGPINGLAACLEQIRKQKESAGTAA
jgi:large subunit ribosomal protein L10